MAESGVGFKEKNRKVFAIVPGGGRGRRMGQSIPKQYLSLCGKPILIHTLEKLIASDVVDEILLVVPESHIQSTHDLVDQYQIPKIMQILLGGSDRQHSVRNALKYIASDTEIVFTHDAVRPFVPADKIRETIDKARMEGAAILASREKCTVKRAVDGRVAETLDRSDLWRVQTPQAFRKDLLFRAYEQAFADDFYGTDDAMLVERLGEPVHIVEGDDRNMKITSPEDMLLAEAILKLEKNSTHSFFLLRS